MSHKGEKPDPGDKRRTPAWLRGLRSLAWIVGVPLLWITGCQSSLIYFPRSYDEGEKRVWLEESGGRVLDYQTSEGRQRAFLQGNLRSPRNLWVVCGGNGSLALDWADWLKQHGPVEDAFLLVDYPGYGDCEGAPNPARIRENFKTVAPLAWREIGSSPDPRRLRFFGHSLGGAACLIAACELGIRRGVLLAPFTSTMEMSREMTGLPLGFLVHHRFDNRARIGEIAAGDEAEILILHGTDDEVIPVTMARTLAREFPGAVELLEIERGRHNTVQIQHADRLAEALRRIGKGGTDQRRPRP